MYILYNDTRYRELKSLTFAPQVDILGNELVVNEFKAEIITDDDITIGKYAKLCGNSGRVWAYYRITEAQRLSQHSVTIKAQSDILILDRKALPAMMCNNTSAKTIINECFTTFGLSCDIADTLADVNLNGYLPEQTARQRLQWVCFVMGAYVQSFFNTKCTIKKIDDTITNITTDKTFYRPKLSYKDYVTSVTATAYSYTAGTPGNTDEWVKVGNTTYIQTSQKASLNNSDAPLDAPDNVVDLSGITIVNEDNVSGVLSRLADEYFNREQLSAEILNEGEVQPADMIRMFDGVKSLITGYVKSASFTFGNSSKSAVVLTQTVISDAVQVTLSYRYDGIEIDRETFNFPPNTDYTLQNSYVDVTAAGQRRVYLPLKKETKGNTGSGDTVKRVNCDIALEYQDNILSILSVDSVTQSEEVVRIA